MAMVPAIDKILQAIEQQQELPPLWPELVAPYPAKDRSCTASGSHYRSCIVETTSRSSGKKLHGDDESFLVRTKLQSSALLTSFNFAIGAVGTIRGIEFAIDPDTCFEVDYYTVTSDAPEAADVVQRVPSTPDESFACLKFIGEIATKASIAKCDHEILEDLKTAWEEKSVVKIWWKTDSHHPTGSAAYEATGLKRIREQANSLFWFRARSLSKGRPQNAWWWSRHELYEPGSIDPFAQFREHKKFVGVPEFLLRPTEDPDLRMVLIKDKIISWFPSIQMFLNLYRIAYLYEMEAVNAAQRKMISLDQVYQAHIQRKGDTVGVTITIPNVPGLDVIAPIGTQLAVKVNNAGMDGSEVRFQGSVYRHSRCRTELSFLSDQWFLPGLTEVRCEVLVTSLKVAQCLNDEYDALTTVAYRSVTFEREGFFSFTNLVRGVQCDTSASIGQLVQEAKVDERIEALCNRLDFHQQNILNAIVLKTHPKSVISIQGYAGAGKSETVTTAAVTLALMGLKTLMVARTDRAADALFSKLVRLVKDYASNGVSISRFLGSGVSALYERGVGILVTTLSACKQLKAVEYPADVLVVEEASTVTEPSLALALVPVMDTVKFVVVVGDPTQTILERQATNNPLGNHIKVSILQRLFDPAIGDPTLSRYELPTNRRQHKEVAAFASKYLCKTPIVCTRPAGFQTQRDRMIASAIEKGWLGFRGSKGGQREAFVDVKGHQYECPPGSGSHSNRQGVKAVVKIVDGLLKVKNVKQHDIAVLSPSHSDVQQISLGLTVMGFTDVEVSTVDQFMGSEADIVVLHLVHALHDDVIRSFPIGRNPFGPMRDEARLMVAMTRARDFQFVVGNWRATQEALKLKWVNNKARYKGIQDLHEHFRKTGHVHRFLG